MSKSQIEARLQKLEETINAPTAVMFFDSQQEYDEYTGPRAKVNIIDDIPNRAPEKTITQFMSTAQLMNGGNKK
jgi:hypothetical protein